MSIPRLCPRLLVLSFATVLLLPAVASAQPPGCMDLAGVDFGSCATPLGIGVIDGQCVSISGCASPVPLFTTFEECIVVCNPEPTCDDLAGIDFGPCDAVLGWGVINGVCQEISGCSSPVPLFDSREACLAACEKPTCDDLAGIDFGACAAILGYGVLDGVCQAISGCSSPVPLFDTLAECIGACDTVPVEESNWGAIKSRYDED